MQCQQSALWRDPMAARLLLGLPAPPQQPNHHPLRRISDVEKAIRSPPVVENGSRWQGLGRYVKQVDMQGCGGALRRAALPAPLSFASPCFRDSASGFRDSAFGFRDSAFGFRDSVFRYRDSGFRFRVSGFWFRVSCFVFRSFRAEE